MVRYIYNLQQAAACPRDIYAIKCMYGMKTVVLIYIYFTITLFTTQIQLIISCILRRIFMD